jgi:hypothetical protein
VESREGILKNIFKEMEEEAKRIANLLERINDELIKTEMILTDMSQGIADSITRSV